MRRLHDKRAAWVLALTLGACTAAPTAPDLTPGTIDFDGNQRLPQGVAPTSYALDLYIVPDADGKGGQLGGQVTIGLDVKEATRTLKLHAESMNVRSAIVEPASGDPIAARPMLGSNGGLVLELVSELPVGSHKLRVTYDAGIDEEPTGLYRVQDQGRWYAYTQFEPLSAREAFPCFDEPRFKTPYTVKLSVRPEHLAIANGPQTAVETRQDAQHGATRQFSFAPTKPLPTYLVAFAVGEFDVVESPVPSPVPLRAITTKGKGELAKYLLEQTPPILKILTDYFGQEYPFAKLDLVAVPNFSAGAMENVGLVTYRETLMLLDPKRATPRARFGALSVTAHELAHMWFGNLVTPAWWDELWLNESFATWMATRVMEQLDPSFEAGIRQANGVARLMSADSLEKTRAIRQPIRHGGDVYNAFDGITYGKGATVLRMAEGWLGADVFRQGVRAFMKDNAYGVVTTPALMAALSKASGKPVYQTLQGFLDQPGVPLVSVALDCSGPKPSVSLSQKRYIPAASKAAQGKPWRVPMCFSYEDGSGTPRRQCEVLDAAQKTISLTEAAACPTWINPNAGAAGYYLWTMAEKDLVKNIEAMRGALSLREQVFLFGQVSSLMKATKLRPKVLLSLASALATGTNHNLVSRALGVYWGMDDIARDSKLEPQHRALLSRLFRPHLDRLGLEPKAGEAPGETALRQNLLRVLGDVAREDYVIANAKGVLAQFLKEPTAVPAWHTSWALRIAVRDGDAALWDALLEIVKTTKNPKTRSAAIRVLGAFDDPALQKKTRALFLTDDVRSSEMWSVVGPLMRTPVVYDQTWAWFTSNFDAIVAKLGKKSMPRLPFVGSGFCDRGRAGKVEAFFKGKVAKNPGMGRNLSMALESIERCRVQRAMMRPAIIDVLGSEKVK